MYLSGSRNWHRSVYSTGHGERYRTPADDWLVQFLSSPESARSPVL